MNDTELASLIEEAGYQFNVESRRYDVLAGATEGEEEGHSSEFVADELGIPLEDLQRWEEELAGPPALEQPADEVTSTEADGAPSA